MTRPTMTSAKSKPHIVLNLAGLALYANQLVSFVQDVAVRHAFSGDDKAFLVATALGLVYLLAPLAGIEVQGENPLPAAEQPIQITETAAPAPAAEVVTQAPSFAAAPPQAAVAAPVVSLQP